MLNRTIAAVSIALVISGASVTVDSSVELPQIESEGSSGRHVTLLPFDHPISLGDSVKAAERISFDTVGYRYLNVGVKGEFYPAADYSPEEFTADFASKFGMEPAIVAFVVNATDDGTGPVPLSRAGEPVPIPTRGILAKEAPFNPPGSHEGILWDAAREAELAAMEQVRSSREPVQVAAATVTEFHPGFSQISLTSGSSNQALIDTQHIWTASRETTAVTPDYWGFEFKVDLINKSIRTNNPDGLRLDPLFPYCTDYPDVEDRFWAKNYDLYSWSVYQIGATSATTLGAYADLNDLYDECWRQSMSVGVGFPRKIPKTPSGNQQLGTEIVARKGTSNRTNNAVTSLIAAKEGYSCVAYRAPGTAYTYGNFYPGTDCMGANVNQKWPSTRQKNFPLLAEKGAAYASDHYTRVPVVTVENGLASPPCVYRDKLQYIDPDGNAVPQRACVAS